MAGLLNRLHWIYRVFDAGDRLLYVGCTTDPHTRFSAHKKRSAWYPDAVRCEWDPVLGREAALIAERRAIRNELPIFNVRGF